MAAAKPSMLPFALSSSSTAAASANYSNPNLNPNNNNNINNLNQTSALDRANYSPNPTGFANPKSYISNGGNNLSRTPSTASTGYFNYHQQQSQPQQRTTVSSAPPVNDDQTLSNTLANASISSPYSNNNLQAQSNRQPKFTEEWDASVRGTSIIESPISQPNQQQNNQRDSRLGNSNMQRSSSVASHRSEVIPNDGSSTHQISLSRGNTLKKKQSLRRSGSLKRSGSRRSMRAGSVRSLALQSSSETDEQHSVFYCPVPTSGNPTEILATRFQAWRKLLKDLIACFREIQSHYEHRSKSLLKLANVLNNTSTPPGFLASGGLDDALQIMRNHHKTSIIEANKAREIEEDVILALTGLRSDLNQKTKEIKSLSGDFKNAVEKEMEGTRKAVNALQEILGQSEVDTASTTGKQDPYLLRLAVDRQVERQLDEENYLHKAYLNLETSGRELESIVVGEIQKSYNAYAGILKRESDAAYNAIDELRVGPISMPKDYEWISFIQRDSQFVDPELPMRAPEQIHYPGRDHYACQEIRAGLLERKSKYLKSYTAGWYVLSPTHLHEFKSADKTQAPVMSLYLPEQKIGSHSTEGGSSNKFILKGRQTGAMHRGHTWVFRAESHDTMMAWYEDIKALTEKSPEELSHFVRDHSRSFSRSSQRSISSDGNLDADEDEEPFTPDARAAAIVAGGPGTRHQNDHNRPEPGGRFPSDLEVTAQRGLQVLPLSSPSSASSGVLDYSNNSNNEYAAAMRGANNNNNQPPQNMNTNGMTPDQNIIAAAVAQPGSGLGNSNDPFTVANNGGQQYGGGLQPPQQNTYGDTQSVSMNQAPSHAAMLDHEARQDGVNPYNGQPLASYHHQLSMQQQQPQRSNSNRFSYTSDSEALDTTTASSPAFGGMQQQQQYQQYPTSSSYAVPINVLNGGVPDSQQYRYAPAPSPATAGGLKQPPAPVAAAADGSLPYTTTRTQDGQIRPLGPGAGVRTDSNPHVPGEYPRSSVGTTPNF